MSFGAVGTSRRRSFSSTRMGPLQRQLQKGEYGFFKSSPMFESDFVQISKHGDPIEVTNEEKIMTVGISFTSPGLPIPDVLLVACPIYLSEDPALPHDTKFHPERKVKYELSRLFPLCLVKISIHNAERQQLRFKLASGRTFYLQLIPESYRQAFLFDSWTRIIQLLWPPPDKTAEMKKKALKSGSIRSSPPPRPKTPSTTTAESKPTVAKSRTGKNRKKKANKAKPPASQGKAPPPNAKKEAELASPLPRQAREVTEVLEEKLVERNPSRRRPIKEIHSRQIRSGQRATIWKVSNLFPLIRSCAGGNLRKKPQRVRSQSKKKKQ